MNSDRQGELPRTGGPLTLTEATVGVLLILVGLGMVMLGQRQRAAAAVGYSNGGRHLAEVSQPKTAASALGMIAAIGYVIYDAVRR